MGQVKVPAERLWGSQTNSLRSLHRTTHARRRSSLPLPKEGRGYINQTRVDKDKADLIVKAADEVIAGSSTRVPPVRVADRQRHHENESTSEIQPRNPTRGRKLGPNPFPNDDVQSQSSNDTFPSAMHMNRAEFRAMIRR